MVLLIDNYDSFSYNLYQLIGSILHDKDQIHVIRNDAHTVDEIKAMNPDYIVISPGPGRPKDAGICEDLIRALNGTVSILGVCLGHQAICEALGARITYASKLMHGKQSDMNILVHEAIFKDLHASIPVARYHSLAVDKDSLPDCLEVMGLCDEGEIMAVRDKNNKTFGLQFHPESIMTPDGKEIMENFLGGGI